MEQQTDDIDTISFQKYILDQNNELIQTSKVTLTFNHFWTGSQSWIHLANDYGISGLGIFATSPPWMSFLR